MPDAASKYSASDMNRPKRLGVDEQGRTPRSRQWSRWTQALRKEVFPGANCSENFPLARSGKTAHGPLEAEDALSEWQLSSSWHWLGTESTDKVR